MAKEWAKAFYKSKAWRKCRAAYIAHRQSIDGGICEVCREKVGYIVHHTVVLTPENINNPDISLNHNLLRYDCKDCHDREEAHAFVKRATLLCAFGDDGQPIPPSE